MRLFTHSVLFVLVVAFASQALSNCVWDCKNNYTHIFRNAHIPDQGPELHCLEYDASIDGWLYTGNQPDISSTQSSTPHAWESWPASYCDPTCAATAYDEQEAEWTGGNPLPGDLKSTGTTMNVHCNYET